MVGNCQPSVLDQAPVPVISEPVNKVDSHQPSLPRRGQMALERLEQNCHHDFNDWVHVTQGMADLQTEAMREARTNTPHGPRYRAAIALKYRLYGFDRIHKSTRSFLLKKFAPNLDAIIAWREKEPPEQQLELNHPQVILRRWKQSLRTVANTNTDLESEPPPPPQIDLEAAWTAASPEQRRNLFDRLGRDGVCGAMSSELLGQFEEHLLGQQIKTADASSSFAITLTRILQHALSSTLENDRAQVVPRIEAKLKANGRTLHDVVIAIADSTAAKRRNARARGAAANNFRAYRAETLCG
jgi:hypothetical protein